MNATSDSEDFILHDEPPERSDDEDEVSSVTEATVIWEDDKIEVYKEDGKLRWRCLWCLHGGVHNHTKALAHAAKKGGHNVAVSRFSLILVLLQYVLGKFQGKERSVDCSSFLTLTNKHAG